MKKKLFCFAAALGALAGSAQAISPTVLTQSVYEKADSIHTLDVSASESGMTAVYIVLGVLLLFVVLFWFFDRRNRRAMKEIQQELDRRNGKQ